MTDSRAKGKRGELEAAEAMSSVLGITFHRTAQRWGKSKADIEPMDAPGLQMFPVHIEVKRIRTGLKWWVGRMDKAPQSAFLDSHTDLYACYLSALRSVAEQSGDTCQLPAGPRVAGFMRQAVRDAKDGALPIVMVRQDNGQWIVAWRYQDDDAFTALVRAMPCDA